MNRLLLRSLALLQFLPIAQVLGADTKTDLQTFMGAHTKVAWTRTLNRHDDIFLQKRNHELMFFDSKENKERLLLSGPDSYQRPLITPDGKYVIYTDFTNQSIYAMPWSEEHPPKLLLKGGVVALDIYEDPQNNTVIIAGTGARRHQGLMVADELISFHFSNPVKTQKSIWSKNSPVTIDGFHVAGDGSHFVSGMPWPDIGYANIASNDWKKATQGCWPSIASAKKGLFWVFDGTHQKVSVFSSKADKKWLLRLDSHPQLSGHEVYHPRWTMNNNYVALTGPYLHKNNTGYGNVGVGGKEVEIWLGKLAPNLEKVDSWFQLTHNQSGDFMPDLWCESKGNLDLELINKNKPHGKLVSDLANQGWRMEKEGLSYLWENRSQRNEIITSTGNIASQLLPKGGSKFSPQYQFDLRSGHAIDNSQQAPDHLAKAIAETNEFSIEMLVQSFEKRKIPPMGNLLWLGKNKQEYNFNLGLHGDNLMINLKGLPMSEKLQSPLFLQKVPSGKVRHVLFTIGKGHVRLYVDGLLKAQGPVKINLKNWFKEGNQLILGKKCPVMISHLAIYNQALDENYLYAKTKHLKSTVKEWYQPTPIKTKATLVKTTRMPVVEDLGAYRRGLVVQQYEKTDPKTPGIEENQFLVAHWAILDHKTVSNVPKNVGKTYSLAIEPYEKHPQLEGEWTAPYEASLLPIYLDVSNPIIVSKP